MACTTCAMAGIECDADETGYPDVTITSRWVAVQWAESGVVHVLEEDGTVTERFTVPADVAQLPLFDAPRPVRVVELPTRGAV